MNVDSKVKEPKDIEGGFVFGRYTLFRKIGFGGMADVFLAERTGSNKEEAVVVKTILPHLAKDPQFVAMFTNEAQLAAQMRHPGIVRVFDFGEFDGRLYMAMEFVDGLDCWRFARRLYPRTKDHTALAGWIVSNVLAALSHAHQMTDVNGRSLNVIHRDLSPSNIYLSISGEVKLGDFGIARVDSSRYRELKMIPKGKFGYVSPEQVEGRPIDQRADIFAIGVVLAELLIGKKMFSGASQLSTMQEIKEGRLDALAQNADRVDSGMMAILLKALAREKEKRFATAEKFRHALLAHLATMGPVPTAETLAREVRRAMDLTEPAIATADIRASNPKFDVRTSFRGIHPSETPMVFTTPHAAPDYHDGVIQEKTDTKVPRYGHVGTAITQTATPYEDDSRYYAALSDGRKVGPTSYAHIIELICSDQIGPRTLVSIGGKTFLPANQFPELNRHMPVYTPTSDIGEEAKPDRQGMLSLESPSQLVIAIAMGGRTGMLVCKTGTKRKEVYFKSGQVIYVSSNDPRELLGEFIVDRGVLKREDLELALALLPRFNGHMADTFIALGLLSAVELFKLIGDQIESRFLDLLGWRTGEYAFYAGVACRGDAYPVTLDIFRMLSTRLPAEARGVPVETTLRALVQGSIRVDDHFARIHAHLEIPEEIDELLKKVKGTVTFDALKAGKTGFSDKRKLVQTLYFAVEAGLWHFEGPSPPWRGEGANP